MKRRYTLSLVACALVGGMVSCGGSSSAPVAAVTPVTPVVPVVPPTPRTTGFAVPSEISPVAATTTTSNAAAAVSLPAGGQVGPKASAQIAGNRRVGWLAAAAAADAGTDYSLAATSRYVAENSIDQFSTIETILNAIAQTHYADAVNIGAGPYKSIVSWQQNNGGNSSVDIQTWVVDSSIIQVDGKDVNQVKCWIEDSGSLVKALFLISASAVQNADGSYANYGTWTVNAKFNDAGTYYFEAAASVDAAGATVVAINQNQDNGNGVQVNQGVMYKTATTGYGKVSYPTQTQNGAPGPQVTDAYTYNASQLLIQDATTLAKVYKDRTTSVELDQQYGMYDAVTGEDVMKTHSFGFPVTFMSGTPATATQAYYGACQGAQQLFLNGGATIPDGTAVTRQDQGNSGATYLTASYTGTLTKRTLVAADISALLNLPVQTWVNSQAQLTWNGTTWMANGAPFTDFASLVAQPQMFVMINGGGGMNQQPSSYVYDPAGPSGAGFYLASNNPQTGQAVSTGVLYSPASNDTLWINIGGSIYIEYLGSAGWVQKTVLSVDQSTNTPTFAANGDTPYSLTLNQQYYIINQGGNYVVTPTGANAYSVQVELLSVANPGDLTAILGSVATFKPQNYDPANPAQTSTYTFDSDPTSASFLSLKYASVGAMDAQSSPAPTVGSPVTTSLSSLMGYDGNGVSQGIQYNWNYPMNGQNFGIQTFLYTVANGVRTYKLLDSPIPLAPLVLHTADGTAQTLSIQFDGWMQGIPQFNNQLCMNGYTMTADIASKIVNIPTATAAVNAVDSTQTYLIKPLQEALYLLVASTPDATLDLTSANAIDLSDTSTLPQYSDNLIGAEPSITVISYADGNPVSN